MLKQAMTFDDTEKQRQPILRQKRLSIFCLSLLASYGTSDSKKRCSSWLINGEQLRFEFELDSRNQPHRGVHCYHG